MHLDASSIEYIAFIALPLDSNRLDFHLWSANICMFHSGINSPSHNLHGVTSHRTQDCIFIVQELCFGEDLFTLLEAPR